LQRSRLLSSLLTYLTRATYRCSVSVPLTGVLHTVPAYVTLRSDEEAPGSAVPFIENGHTAAVPFVVQFIVVPLSVPFAVPDTGTPAHVAVYTIVAVVAPVGVTVQFMALQAPAVAVERQVPLNALSAVGVGDGVDGVGV